MKTKKFYSLCLVPEKGTYKNKVSKVINDLAKQYKAPVFEPHVTVLGSIPRNNFDLEKVKKIVSETKPFELTTQEVSFSTTHFQSVFVRIRATARLMEFNLKLKKIFNKHNDVFMPHLSLMYGDHEMKTREEIVSKLRLEKDNFKAGSIEAIGSSTSDPAEWEQIGEFKFKK